MDVFTWLQIVTVGVPFLAMIAVCWVLIAEERHEDRMSRTLNSRRRASPSRRGTHG